MTEVDVNKLVDFQTVHMDVVGDQLSIISMHEISIVDNWAYGINYKYNFLCKICIPTNKIEKIHSLFSDEEEIQYSYTTEFYNHILATESLIYFVDDRKNKLLIFDKDLHLVEKFLLLEKLQNMNIIGINSNVLYIYAVLSGIVISVDIDTNRISNYQVPEKYIGKINSMEIKIIDNCLWLTGYMGNVVVEIQIESGEIYEHRIDITKGDICLCCKNEDSFWLCTQYEIIEWNKKQNVIKRAMDLPYKIEQNECDMPFYYSRIINECLWLFPFKEKFILKMDVKKNSVELVTVKKEKEKSKRQKTFSYLAMDTCRNVVYGLDSDMNNIIINLSNGKIIYTGFCVEDSLYNKVKEDFFKNNICLNEYMFDIFELLEDTYKHDLWVGDTNVGEKIYERCY